MGWLFLVISPHASLFFLLCFSIFVCVQQFISEWSFLRIFAKYIARSILEHVHSCVEGCMAFRGATQDSRTCTQLCGRLYGISRSHTGIHTPVGLVVPFLVLSVLQKRLLQQNHYDSSTIAIGKKLHEVSHGYVDIAHSRVDISHGRVDIPSL